MSQMESVRQKIHEHIASVGEEMLIVLDKYTSDACFVRFDVRVFVLERLTEVAEFFCNLFQSEMETLLNTKPYTADFLHVLVCKEEVSLVQEGKLPPQIKEEQNENEEEQEELVQRPEEAEDTQSHLDSIESPLTHSPLPSPMVNSADVDFALLSSSLSSTSPCSLPPSSPGLGAPPGDPATVAILPDTPSPTPSPSSGESEEEKAKKLFYCSVCKVAINSLSQLEAHNKDHHRERSIEYRETASKKSSTFSEEQHRGRGLLDARLKPVVKLYRINVHNPPVREEQVSAQQQEQPEPPQNEVEHEEVLQRTEKNEEFTWLTLPIAESEDDDEHVETESVASTSTEPMKTQAGAADCGISQSTSDEQMSSESCRETKEEKALKSQKTENVKGKRSLNNKISRGQKSIKQTDSVRSSKGSSQKCSQKRPAKRPVKSHTNQVPLTCEVCGKLYSSKSNLNTHMKLHTEEKPYTCTVCYKDFRALGALQLHMRTHTGEKPFTCATCGKCFSHSSHLKRHLTIHTGEKAYTCEVCQKAFSQLYILQMHMKIHTGDRPFTCSVCCKDFRERSHLKEHMRVHTGERPFSCLVCGHRFNHKNKLKIHMRTHTGEKPYTCTFCARQFSRNDKLKQHCMRTHTGEKNKISEDS